MSGSFHSAGPRASNAVFPFPQRLLLTEEKIHTTFEAVTRPEDLGLQCVPRIEPKLTHSI